jgi:PAS domain S-box-containing protein
MNKISIEDYYRVFIENSLDAILLTNPDGRINWANRAACEMFCMIEKEICDAGRKGLVDTDDPRLKEALERRSKEGRVRTELTLIRKDGTSFPGELTSSFVYTTSGEVLTIIMVRDVSIWKETERLLKKGKSFLWNLQPSII